MPDIISKALSIYYNTTDPPSGTADPEIFSVADKFGAVKQSRYLIRSRAFDIKDISPRKRLRFAILGITRSAFDEAVSLNPDAHPLFHSDRGFQYTSKIFHQMLVDAGMRQSMSRVGRCIDNGSMEGYWGILKSEMYYLRKFTSKEKLTSAIEAYITYYNTRRYQLRLNCMTPIEYHKAYAA